jgi:23S rRNA pseudouridine1911/1915/1917 synthase
MSTRSFTVGRREAGRSLADFLSGRLQVPRAQVSKLVRDRQVRLAGSVCRDPGRRLEPGQRIAVEEADQPASAMPAVLVHLDEQIVVVDKPAGLTTVRHAEDVAEFGRRARRYLPPTLADLVPPLIAQAEKGKPTPVRAVHRLDNETSGLVAFARTVEAERHLGRQFRAHSTDRRYLALVRGQAQDGRIESWLVRDRGDGRRGSGPAGTGQHAVTNVRVVEKLGDFTLVECRLETGRTHQVRIHLGEAGTPLCGERVYDRPLHGRPLPDASGIDRIALHAATLGFDHPGDGRRVRWTSPLPRDLAELLKRLRRSARGTV